jgi:hypothetical protein
MTSIRCPQCGLVYWNTNPNCRRCGLATAVPVVGHPINSGSFEEGQLIHNLERDCKLFYVIGGLQIGLWLFVGNLLILDGICNIGLSFVTQRFKSRVAAILLMLLTCLSVLAGMVAFATGALHFNPIAPLLLIGRLVVSIRLVVTTFKLNQLAPVDVTRMMPPLPPVFHQDDEPQWAQPVGSAQMQLE